MFRRLLNVIVSCASVCAMGQLASAAVPVSDPVFDPPTLHCLGVYWVIQDSDSAPAAVDVKYRRAGTGDWEQGFHLLRVRKGPGPSFLDEGGHPKQPALPIPEDAHLFAGSILRLAPNTDYEVQLTLHDSAGPDVVKVIKDKTLSEPIAPKNEMVRYVAPGDGGGSGTAADPFKGLAAAEKASRPGDLFMVHAGHYTGTFTITHSGEPGHPVIWRGAGNVMPLIDGGRPANHLDGHTIDAENVHDVWFENLEITSAYSAICAHNSSRIVVRRCSIHNVLCGVYANKPTTPNANGFFISDNMMEGIMSWPVSKEQYEALPESRGIWLCGSGNVVCYNRINHFKDAMDIDESLGTISDDFHNNEVSNCFDDGCEMDGSDRNTRNYNNRYTDTLTCVSCQPVHGGPCYIFENVIFNPLGETFKLHNSPSGVFIFQNTSLKHGVASSVATSSPLFDIVMRNNLFIGTSGRTINYDMKMVDCSFDYDGYGGCNDPTFMKWDEKKYTLAELPKAPAESHSVQVDPQNLFASNLQAPAKFGQVFEPASIDVRLKPSSKAVASGENIPGLTNSKNGHPDLGAYQLGEPIPHYGPRTQKESNQ